MTIRSARSERLDALLARRHVRGETRRSTGHWLRIVLFLVGCRYCLASPGRRCVKRHSNAARGEPADRGIHEHRERDAIAWARAQDGCEVCGGRDLLAPRRCTTPHIHAVCFGCWETRWLRGDIPSTLLRCPGVMREDERAVIVLSHATD